MHCWPGGTGSPGNSSFNYFYRFWRQVLSSRLGRTGPGNTKEGRPRNTRHVALSYRAMGTYAPARLNSLTNKTYLVKFEKVGLLDVHFGDSHSYTINLKLFVHEHHSTIRFTNSIWLTKTESWVEFKIRPPWIVDFAEILWLVKSSSISTDQF